MFYVKHYNLYETLQFICLFQAMFNVCSNYVNHVLQDFINASFPLKK